MRLLTLSGLATLTAAGLLAALPAAAFAGDGGGTRGPTAAQRGGQAAAAPADRLQQALAACRARGFADGSDDQRRCAERLLGGAATPASTTAPPPTPPPATTTAPPPPVGAAQPADRQQQALAACRARGFADDSNDQRRCVERLLGGAAAPAPTTTQPPAATTAPRPPPTTVPPVRPATTAAPAPRGPVVTDRGIVQSAAPGALVLRALDGSSLVVSVDGRTKIYVGDRSAGVADIQPGSVATVRHQDSGPALEIRVALPPKPKLRTDRGITESVSAAGIVIRLRDGTAISIAVGRSTRLEASNGRVAAPVDLRVGLLVDVLYDPAGATPAQSVKIIRRVS